MRYLPLVSIVALMACSAPKGEPAVHSDSKVVAWTAIADTTKPAADGGAAITVQLRATITGGWHVYSLGQTTGGPVPMTVKVSPPYEISGEIQAPTPVKARDPNFGIETETYSGEQIFRIPLKLAASSSVSPPPLELKVRSQACSDNLCLPAKTTTLTVTPQADTP
jgi:DsbC/DsbD-like thiol-disulfide interchange protein